MIGVDAPAGKPESFASLPVFTRFTLLGLFAVGVGVRVLQFGDIGYEWDMRTIHGWAQAVLERGLIDFWRNYQEYYVYLPGGLYLVTALKVLALPFGTSVVTYVSVTKAFHLLVDLFLAAQVVRVAREYGRLGLARSLALAAFAFLTPSIWFVTGVMGLAETLQVVLALQSILLLHRERGTGSVSPAFASGACFALALGIKLLVAVMIPVLLLDLLARKDRRFCFRWASGFTLVTLALVAVPLLARPGRLYMVYGQPYFREALMSVGASTFWTLVGAGRMASDPVLHFGPAGLSVAAAGLLIYVAAMFSLCFVHFGWKGRIGRCPIPALLDRPPDFLSTCHLAVLSTGFFYLFFPKMHTRYLHVGAVFAVVSLAGLGAHPRAQRWLLWAALLHAGYFLSNLVVFHLANTEHAWVGDLVRIIRVNPSQLAALLQLLGVLGLYGACLDWGLKRDAGDPVAKVQP